MASNRSPLDEIREESAIRERVSGKPLTQDRTLVRRWDGIGPQIVQQCTAHLRSNASLKNNSASKTVTDPLADKKVHEGLWRNVTVDWETKREVSRIVQVLKLGYITSLTTATLWDEARLVEEVKAGTGDQEGTAVIRWQNVDPGALHNISEFLDQPTYNNVTTINSDDLDGTWHNLFVRTYRDEDGAGVVDLHLSRTYVIDEQVEGRGTFRENTVTKYHNVPASMKAGVISNHQPGDRKTVSTDSFYNYGTGRYQIVVRTGSYARRSEDVDWKPNQTDTRRERQEWHLTAAEVDTFVDTTWNIDAAPANGVDVRLTRSYNAESDTWDLLFIEDTRSLVTSITETPIGSVDAPELTIWHEGRQGERRAYTWHDIDATNIGTIRLQLRQASAPAGWGVLRHEESFSRQRGTYRVTWTIAEATTIGTTSIVGLVQVGSTTPGFFKRKIFVEKHVPFSDLSARIAHLEDENSWGSNEIVESVRPGNYDGGEFCDLWVTIVVLPSTWFHVQDFVNTSNAPYEVNSWLLSPNGSRAFPTAHDNTPDSGRATAWSKLPTLYSAIGTAVVGPVIRVKRVTTTYTYNKGAAPSKNGVTGTYGNHVYDDVQRHPRLGFWIKKTVQIQIFNWGTSP